MHSKANQAVFCVVLTTSSPLYSTAKYYQSLEGASLSLYFIIQQLREREHSLVFSVHSHSLWVSVHVIVYPCLTHSLSHLRSLGLSGKVFWRSSREKKNVCYCQNDHSMQWQDNRTGITHRRQQKLMHERLCEGKRKRLKWRKGVTFTMEPSRQTCSLVTSSRRSSFVYTFLCTPCLVLS